MRRSHYVILSAGLSLFPVAVQAQPAAVPAIRQIDFTLQSRSLPAVWAPVLKGPHGLPSRSHEYRIEGQRYPEAAAEEERSFSVYSVKLAFEPSAPPHISTSTQSPASKIRDLHAVIAVHRPLSKNTALTMGWQAARLASYNGNVTADGSGIYSDKTSDYFLPQLALDARFAPGLNVRANHHESLQINMDTAIFGPRTMFMEEWMSMGRGIDFQRRTANGLTISWNITDALALRGHVTDISYRNRMMANHRGLLRPLPGTSRAQQYRGSAEWMAAPDLRLNVEAAREDMHDTAAFSIAGHRDKWSVGMERSGPSRNLRIAVGRQSTAHFGPMAPGAAAQITFRSEWTVEAGVEQRLFLTDAMPQMVMQIEARTAPLFSALSPGQMAGLSSREIQPQIRLSLNTRW